MVPQSMHNYQRSQCSAKFYTEVNNLDMQEVFDRVKKARNILLFDRNLYKAHDLLVDILNDMEKELEVTK